MNLIWVLSNHHIGYERIRYSPILPHLELGAVLFLLVS